MRSFLCFLLPAMLVAACEPAESDVISGISLDAATTELKAGPFLDSGPDAQAISANAGSVSDAGGTADAGVTADAGRTADAGSVADAGSTLDAAPSDGGVFSDGGGPSSTSTVSFRLVVEHSYLRTLAEYPIPQNRVVPQCTIGNVQRSASTFTCCMEQGSGPTEVPLELQVLTYSNNTYSVCSSSGACTPRVAPNVTTTLPNTGLAEVIALHASQAVPQASNWAMGLGQVPAVQRMDSTIAGGSITLQARFFSTPNRTPRSCGAYEYRTIRYAVATAPLP